MRRDWDQQNINDLATHYLKAMQELKSAICKGAGWEEINDKRSVLAELTMAMNRCPNMETTIRQTPQ